MRKQKFEYIAVKRVIINLNHFSLNGCVDIDLNYYVNADETILKFTNPCEYNFDRNKSEDLFLSLLDDKNVFIHVLGINEDILTKVIPFEKYLKIVSRLAILHKDAIAQLELHWLTGIEVEECNNFIMDFLNNRNGRYGEFLLL